MYEKVNTQNKLRLKKVERDIKNLALAAPYILIAIVVTEFENQIEKGVEKIKWQALHQRQH